MICDPEGCRSLPSQSGRSEPRKLQDHRVQIALHFFSGAAVAAADGAAETTGAADTSTEGAAEGATEATGVAVVALGAAASVFSEELQLIVRAALQKKNNTFFILVSPITLSMVCALNYNKTLEY